jgi:serine/threonine protein kinase/tetratricopeptide (TPR) repeat protein
VSLTTGARLAQFEILGLIGAGGMGEVYRARDRRLERDVALKVLPEAVADDPEMKSRFEREARAIAALSHPNILAIHELAVVDGRPVAVVELLDGETLRAKLARNPLPWREAAALGARIADGLAAAHDRGIIHRDLKPDNIIVTSEGRPKILDFGLARSTSEVERLDPSAETIAVTEAGRVMGTVGYMAPEQVRGAEAGPAADIFALGCTLSEMLTGQRPFVRSTVAESLAAVLHEEPPALPPREVPAGLRAVIEHCLEKVPDDRFSSARDVADALRAQLADSSTSITPVGDDRKRRRRTRSLAVLPFTHASGDVGTEYLSDGLTESVINSLSQLPKLRVVPRSIAFRYKAREVDIRSMGLALNATQLVTGRVAQQGEQLHIQVELVDVATESQVWGDRFRYPVSEIFDAQEQIAWQISEALRIRLSGEEKKRIRRRPTRDQGAYHEYLKGRHAWSLWTPEGFKRAIEHFEAAIARDPSYALAYAGLSDTFGAMAYYGYAPPAIAHPRAEAAARRALELDDRIPEAHTTAGQSRFFFHRDWTGAERAFRRAIEIAPRHAPAYTFLALLLAALGRLDEAAAAAARGSELDPLSPVMQMGRAWVAFFRRQFSEVVDLTRELLSVSPDFVEANTILLITYESSGQLERALDALRKGARCFRLTEDGVPRLRAALASGGARGYWLQRLAMLDEIADSGYVPALAYATVLAKLDDRDRAFAHLERMADEQNGQAVFLAVNPGLDPLRDDPRFDALLRRVGLPVLQGVT